MRDIAPGEAMVVCHGVGGAPSVVHARQCSDASASCLRPCIFEYVYFARPDSVMDGVAVYQSRLEMGERLARRIQQLRPAHDIDVVIPIPDTARTCALQAAYTLGVPYREGFIKNRYIARTFIMPGQQQRRKSVRLKLNTIRAEFRGKAVLLVDDSIVRGTTSKELVLMAREAGARTVFVASDATDAERSALVARLEGRHGLVAAPHSVAQLQLLQLPGAGAGASKLMGVQSMHAALEEQQVCIAADVALLNRRSTFSERVRLVRMHDGRDARDRWW